MFGIFLANATSSLYLILPAATPTFSSVPNSNCILGLRSTQKLNNSSATP